jgi:predicted ATPase
MKINLAGAYSEGKTTIKDSIARRYNLISIPEQPRLLAAEKEIESLAKFRSDTSRVTDFQLEIMQRQYNEEVNAEDNYVSCRCIDCIAFLAHFGSKGSLNTLRQTTLYKSYLSWLRNSIIFYILPHKELMYNDGFRDTNYEQAVFISGSVRMIFEMEGLNYIPVYPLTMADREKLIFSYLDLIKEKENGIKI